MIEPIDAILARLELVGVEARRRSAEIESQRALPRDLVDALTDTGVFRLSAPPSLGGAGGGLTSIIRAVRLLAPHDASTGWVVMAALLAGLDAAQLPRHHASTVLAEPRTIVAGHRGGGGTARRTDDGGLMVSGRWSWGAGVAASSWIVGGVRIAPEPEPEPGPVDPFAPEVEAPAVKDLGVELDVLCLFRRDQVVVLDTWHAMGLQGAGATDFEVIEAFVPEGRWIGPLASPSVRVDSVDGTDEVDGSDSAASRRRSGFDHGDLVAVGAASVALGLADRAIEEADGLAPAEAIGRWTAAIGAAGTFLERVATEVVDPAGQAGPGLPPEVGPEMVAAALHAVEAAVGVVEAVYRLGGPEAVLHASILQRLLRDVQTVAQYPAVSSSRWSELDPTGSGSGATPLA